MRCFHNTFTDIYFHLAAEEYLLKQETDSVFMLWQDTPSVVMGKHQSVQLEVNREWAEEQQIQIARRFSGGGAVYHDLGNVNLTFIETVSRLPDFSLYLHRILDFLKQIESDNELKKQFISETHTTDFILPIQICSYHHFTHYIRLSGRREPAFRNFTGEYRKQTARTCRTAHQTDTSGWNYCMAELPHNSHLSCHF